MLSLKNVTKVYSSGENEVRALKGVSVSFRSCEFVSVLGPSGCGKTTMLNILGGLDRYTSGDLIINGVSTENYKDADWDAYRNHSVGFVFQSYNLIPHQTVVKNVELALTLSGVGKQERRERAIKALEKVGLADQINKRPNQLSGGQMQRVAIARAIVNDPEIILADEPTGALDSETSVQVMDILKELSLSRLVVMVTHNGDLAEEYSTRIINLNDGLIVNDSAPFSESDEQNDIVLADENTTEDIKSNDEKPVAAEKKKAKKPSMSLLTAFSLSLNNLFTKKARTILTAFAGSIGIIGIALILSLSAGFNSYIDTIQRDTLSNYPVTINRVSVDTTSLVNVFFGEKESDLEEYPDTKTVTSRRMMEDLLTGVIATARTNDLKSFKPYLEQNLDKSIVSSIQYGYGVNKKIYYNYTDVQGNVTNRKIYPIELPDFSTIMPGSSLSGMDTYYEQFDSYLRGTTVFSEMIDNQALLKEQYDLLEGSWPNEADEAVLVVDKHNQISDVQMYMLGLMDDSDITYLFTKLALMYINRQKPESEKMTEEQIDAYVHSQLGYGRHSESYSFNDLIKLEYRILLSPETYKKAGDPVKRNGEDFQLWQQKTDEEIQEYIDAGNYQTLKISGIVRQNADTAAGALTGVVCYTKALTEKLMQKGDGYEVVKQLKAMPFRSDNGNGQITEEYFSVLAAEEGSSSAGGELITEDTYRNQCKLFSVTDPETPESIVLYFKDFAAKDKFAEFIDEYNKTVSEEKQIKYSDYVGMLMSSVTDIVNAITYVLIAFVSISLIVSSIMIGVITHISVLERTKEIGVLRSIGASKRDVSRVFNAETFIIGLVAGVLGILITLVLNIPINIIIEHLAKLKNIAALPVLGAFALIAVSVLLTVIAGLIPARGAAKKDPVEALRTE